MNWSKYSLRVKFPKNFAQKIFVVASFALFFFGLWQMDLLCIPHTWGVSGWANGYFEMGRIGDFKIAMTSGTGYDLTQIFMVVGFLLAVLSLWLWDE